MHRGWLPPKLTHPRCTANYGPSAVEPVAQPEACKDTNFKWTGRRRPVHPEKKLFFEPGYPFGGRHDLRLAGENLARQHTMYFAVTVRAGI